MEKSLESEGQSGIIDQSLYDRDLALQKKIIKSVLDAVDTANELDSAYAATVEMIEESDINAVHEAMMGLKNMYMHFGLPASVDFFQTKKKDGTSEQGFYIEINLHPEALETAEVSEN